MDNTGVKLLCFNLRRMSRSLQFIVLTLSVFSFHLIQGYYHVRKADIRAIKI